MKNPTFIEGGSRKTNIEGGLPKKEGLGSLPIWGVAWQERGGGVLIPNAHYGEEDQHVRFSQILPGSALSNQYSSSNTRHVNFCWISKE